MSQESFAQVAHALAHETLNLALAAELIEAQLDDGARNRSTTVRGSLAVLRARLDRLGTHLAQLAEADRIALVEADLGAVLRDAIERVEAVTDGRGGFVTELEPGGQRALGDTERLGLALSYLMLHAAMRVPPGQVVAVSAQPLPPAHDRAPMFGFTVTARAASARRAAATRVTGESGLELMIAERIARSHGGHLDVVRDDHGLALTLAVPATEGR